MKRVLFVIGSMFTGGAEKSLISLLAELEAMCNSGQVCVDVLVLSGSGSLLGQFPSFIELVPPSTQVRRYSKSLKALIREGDYSLHTLCSRLWFSAKKKLTPQRYTFSSDEYLWREIGETLPRLEKKYDIAVAYMNGTPTFYTADKVNATRKIAWVHNNISKLNYDSDFEKAIYERFDRIVTVSENCRKDLASFLRRDLQDIDVIENIVDVAEVDRLSKELLEEEWIANSAEPVVLSIGRLADQKGFDLGMRALAEVGCDFRWVILGQGPEETKLKELARDLRLEDKVEFLGVKKNPYPYIKRCDLFYQPSRYEGKSIALDEALCLDSTVLVTPYETAGDTIIDGVNGIVSSFEIETMANDLEAVLCIPDPRGMFISEKRVYRDSVIERSNIARSLIIEELAACK